MIKLVLTDLDDTLIPHSAPGISPRAAKAMHTLLDDGACVGPVSGRVPKAMGWMLGGDESLYQTGAFCNGQIVYLNGKKLAEVPVDSDLLTQVVSYLDKLGDAALGVYDVAADKGATLITQHPERLYGHPVIFSESEGEVSTKVPERVIKCNVHIEGDYQHRYEVRDQLCEAFPDLSFVLPSLIAPLIDICPADCDKGTAVKTLIEALGIDNEQAVCFGDSENDLAMLDAVTNSVGVANADETVASRVKWHIGPSDQDSVAQAMEQIATSIETKTVPSFMRE